MNTRFLKIIILSSALLPLAFASSLTYAGSIFANFDPSDSGTNFIFKSGETSASFKITESTVDFEFKKVVIGLPSSFYSDQPAALVFSGTTSTKADKFKNRITQDIDTDWSMSFTSATGKNLLTVVVNNDDPDNFSTFFGYPGNKNLSLLAGDPAQNVVFTSDFVNFGPTSQDSVSLSLLLTKGLSIGANGFLSNFDADINGLFSSETAPAVSPDSTPAVPEPGIYSLLLGGLGLLGFMKHRRKHNSLICE